MSDDGFIPDSQAHDDGFIPDQQSSTQDTASAFYRPALEYGGLALGAAAGGGAGLPTGPGAVATGAVGAGLGYAAGKQAANIVDEFRGIRQRPQLGQQMTDTAHDTLEGAATELGGPVLGQAIGGAGRILGKAGKLGVSAVLGPSLEAIDARLANPEAIKGAASYGQLADKLPNSLKKVSDAISAAYKVATGHLRNSQDLSNGAIPKSEIQALIGGLRSKLDIGGSEVGTAEKAAGSQLQGLFSDIENILQPKAPAVRLLGATGQELPVTKPDVAIPETMVKRVIQAVDKTINWDDKGASAANSALTDFRAQLDQKLKLQNTSYADAMARVNKLERVYNDAKNAFSLTSKTGEGLAPTDSTISKIQSLPQERKGVSQKVSRRLGAVTGDNYTGASKQYGIAKQFEGGRTNGSRMVNAGTMIGGGTGALASHLLGLGPAASVLGGMVGTGTGLVIDRQGGKIAGSLLDTAGNIASNTLGTRQVMANPFLRRLLMLKMAQESRPLLGQENP